MNKVLIVIDAQEDFTRGALRNEEAIKALPVIHDIVRYARENHFTGIFYTQDTHDPDYSETQEGRNLPVPHCIEGTKGWEICPEVYSGTTDQQAVYFIKKGAFGSRDWTGYGHLIQNADEIWMCGFCTDICVSANFQILKATFPEVPVIVIEDACAGVTPELHEAALKVMKSCQAKVIPWNDLKSAV